MLSLFFLLLETAILTKSLIEKIETDADTEMEKDVDSEKQKDSSEEEKIRSEVFYFGTTWKWIRMRTWIEM